MKDNKPLRRAERQHTRGALLILGSLLCAFAVNDILMSVFKTDTAPMR